MNIADELHKLHQLHESGAINDNEFARAKARVLDGSATASGVEEPPRRRYDDEPDEPPRRRYEDDTVNLEQQARQWAMFLHFSLLAGYLVPLAGLVVPIVIWQIKKDELQGIDRHGRIVVNWIISHLIYLVVCIPLAFVVIGIPLLIALGIMAVVFPIIGGIKANNGEVWKYPLSIPFFHPLGAEEGDFRD